MIPQVNPSRSPHAIRAEKPWLANPVRYTVAVLALVATLVAGYLTWTTYDQRPVAGCSETNVVGCDQVLSSAWSKYLGLPTAALGGACYAAIFALALATSGRGGAGQRWLGTALTMLALMAAGAATWFILLQIFLINKICIYCMAVHGCGLVTAGLVVWSALGSRARQFDASRSAIFLAGAMSAAAPSPRSRGNSIAGPSLTLAVSGAVAGLVLLIGGQIAFPPQTYDISSVTLDEPIEPVDSTNARGAGGEQADAETEPHVVHRVSSDPPTSDNLEGESEDDEAADAPAAEPAAPSKKREVSLLGGTLTIDLYQEAVLGSREAPHVVVEIMDYTCPHCRELHESIKLADRRYGDQLAIVVMPAPLELECNKRLPKTDPMHRGACRLARLAISVAQVDPSEFRDFHNFLLSDIEDVPSYSTSVMRAFRLVDRKKLSQLTKSDEIENRIQRYIKLFATIARSNRTKGKPSGLPLQIVGDKVLSGKFDSPEDMFATWDEALGIESE